MTYRGMRVGLVAYLGWCLFPNYMRSRPVGKCQVCGKKVYRGTRGYTSGALPGSVWHTDCLRKVQVEVLK